MRYVSEGYGAKVGATAIIWSLAAGIMAICIPMVRIFENGFILPLAVIIGLSISTVAIWFNGNQKSIESEKKIQAMERRIRDLETISSSENFVSNKSNRSLDK